mgnify:FL=1
MKQNFCKKEIDQQMKQPWYPLSLGIEEEKQKKPAAAVQHFRPDLKAHILKELEELQGHIVGYKNALENHPHATHEHQLKYIERYIARLIYSLKVYF